MNNQIDLVKKKRGKLHAIASYLFPHYVEGYLRSVKSLDMQFWYFVLSEPAAQDNNKVLLFVRDDPQRVSVFGPDALVDHAIPVQYCGFNCGHCFQFTCLIMLSFGIKNR